MNKFTRLQIASDKIAHLAETLEALDREINALASKIGEDLMARVEAAFPTLGNIGPKCVKRLSALSRDLEPQDY
jgi:hypothetical protein